MGTGNVSISEPTKTSETTKDLVYLAYDPVSSDIVTQELEKAGYRIKVTSSTGETIFCLREPKYAALIVGPLVQSTERFLLASELRRRKSNTKVVFLFRDPGQKSSDELGADAVVSLQNGPESVIRILKKLLVSNL